MRRRMISFKMTNQNINRFIHISEQASGPVTLLRGARAVDGCSPIGVMTINVEQPFTIEYPDDEKFEQELKQFAVFYN